MESWTWRAWSTALAVAIAAVAIVPAWAEKPPRRKGKDVRVERVYRAARDNIRFCTLLPDEDAGMCFGKPRSGDKGHVFDYDGPHLGVIRAGASRVSERYPCHMDSVFDFEYTALSGEWAKNRGSRPLAFAFFGLDVVPDRARMVMHSDQLPSPAEMTEGEPFAGLDRDGDGAVDFILASFECTDVEPPPSSSSSSSSSGSAETYCFDYWILEEHRWSKRGRDVFYSCN